MLAYFLCLNVLFQIRQVKMCPVCELKILDFRFNKYVYTDVNHSLMRTIMHKIKLGLIAMIKIIREIK